MNRFKKSQYLFPKLILGITFLLSSVACSPPVGVNNLADIQRTFSETSTKDNQFDQNMLSKTSAQDIEGASLDSVTISIGYASVLDQLKKLPKEQKASLRQSGLWGNVLMLKAMSEWRLQKNVAALETLQEIKGKTYSSLGNRDKVMFHMIPGLIKNDEFYQQLKQVEGQSVTVEKAQSIQEGFSSALSTLHAALDQSSSNQQMRRYMLISYLGAFKNSQDACELSTQENLGACINHKRCEAFASYIELEKSLDGSSTSSSFLKNVRGHWIGQPNAAKLKKAHEKCKAKVVSTKKNS